MRKINNIDNYFNGRKEASLMLIKQCPLCNNSYHPQRTEILEEGGNTFLAHLSCSYCGSHLIIRVVASAHGLIGTASITDLQANEVLIFRDEEVISVDDILELAELIKKNDLLNDLL